MLREISNARQINGEPMRRWFCSHEQDLYVWYDEDGHIVAFQLCYAKSVRERAVYWRADRGYSHLKVEEGRRAETPLMVADGAFDKHGVLAAFSQHAIQLPADIREFVMARINEYVPSVPPPASKKPWWRFW